MALSSHLCKSAMATEDDGCSSTFAKFFLPLQRLLGVLGVLSLSRSIIITDTHKVDWPKWPNATTNWCLSLTQKKRVQDFHYHHFLLQFRGSASHEAFFIAENKGLVGLPVLKGLLKSLPLSFSRFSQMFASNFALFSLLFLSREGDWRFPKLADNLSPASSSKQDGSKS